MDVSVQENRGNFFPGNEYIIDDKAYPVLAWCIAPYINKGNLTEAQINFNRELSKMRQIIKRAFALLKRRFRRLKYLHMSVADLIPYVILACYVLHNLCLAGCNDRVDDFIEEGRRHDERNGGEQNQQNQNKLTEEFIFNNAVGPAKHNYLAALIGRVMYNYIQMQLL
ncbi:PREDICTED: uncharacterized protein LOC108764588 [Trachymyrmex cornetzi]|uniref:uncharacterized protein LOC108764588 n=1 Tax=Trachymyrmex cornetzi TaxID=471704 RepID=UPI00084F55C2|nr:PREDICTED: uncharacterized protein LOC108764588 [Trachymyrmex cornetzi]